MATMKVSLCGGYFGEIFGSTQVWEKSPTCVVGNGWDCSIQEDGTILCESIRSYSDGIHSIRYKIMPNGYARLTLKVPGERLKILRKGFVLPRGRKLENGLLGLAGGNVDERYAFFRDEDFQNFLEDHGISAVQHENPNKVFRVRNARYGGGNCHSELYSDGTVTRLSYSDGKTADWERQSPGTSCFEVNEDFEVTAATWVLHTQSQHEGNSHNCFRILYTLEDPTKLVGLPRV